MRGSDGRSIIDVESIIVIAVVGSGDIGGAAARHLAAADLAARIVLIDDDASVAAGKALDIAQAGPVDRYTTRLSGTADLSAVVGAALIVIADRAAAPAGEWTDDAGLALLKRVGGLNQLAPIVFAGPRAAALIERGVGELGLSPTRLCGSAPEALRAAVVTMTALTADATPQQISLSVTGRAPGTIIVGWPQAAIDGRPAPDVLSAAELARLDAVLPRLWPPGPIALGSAVAAVARSMLTRSRRLHTALVVVPRADGGNGRATMLPVAVDGSGVIRVVTPALSIRDRVRLDTVLRP
jgi:malate dehydrogenase